MATDALGDLGSSGNASRRSAIVFAVVLTLAYAPLMILQFRNLWETEQYQYFPFVIGAATWMTWERWGRRTHRDTRRTGFGRAAIILFATAWALLVMAGLFLSPWLATVSFAVVAAAIICALSMDIVIPGIWWVWSLLWLNVPPPIEFGTYAVQRLQLLSSQLSSAVLDQIGVLHMMDGNVLTLPTRQLFVDEACSGIVSVMSIIAVAAIYSVWKQRRLLHTMAVVVLGVAWAIGMNTTRICVIGVAEARWGVDLAEGWQHDVLGLALFVFSFVALISTDILLEFALHDIPDATFANSKNWLIDIWNYVVCIGSVANVDESTSSAVQSSARLGGIGSIPLVKTSIAFAALAAFQVVVAGTAYSKLNAPSLNPIVTAAVSREFAPANYGEWELVDFKTEQRDRSDDFGQNSAVFVYENAAFEAPITLSVDYSFNGGWHELAACYRAIGWAISDRGAVGQNSVPHVECTMTRSQTTGYLLFTNCDSDGETLSPPADSILWHPWFFTRRRALRYMAKDIYQVQTLYVSAGPPDQEVKDACRELLCDVHSRLTELLAAESAD